MKLSSLSILIPAYKDQNTIVDVVKKSVRLAKKIAKTYEIVVLNDASPDATKDVLLKLKKYTPRMRIVTHKVNRGYGVTIRDLYLAARSEWLFSVPGDGQIDPSELLKLIPHTKRYDLIIGRRLYRQDNPKRKFQSTVYNTLLHVLYGVRIHDINSVRLMRKTIVERTKFSGTSAFIDAELTIQAIKNGFRVTEAVITHQPRRTGGSGGGKLSVILPVIVDMFLYWARTTIFH